ncbi:hypothetical protein MKX01_005185, partial [Papaver californicum]
PLPIERPPFNTGGSTRKPIGGATIRSGLSISDLNKAAKAVDSYVGKHGKLPHYTQKASRPIAQVFTPTLGSSITPFSKKS